jgi:putative transposase
MPRAHRYFTEGRLFHVTHRCHNRSFLLKFAKDRDAYRMMLRERLGRFRIPLVGYCLTSNHVHLLIKTPDRERVAVFMQSLAGDFAQQYNIRKRRNGAYWGDRYHATIVDGRRYLWSCLVYIDLNMVRAGVVKHPGQWSWCGYQELTGERKRYRVNDLEALLESIGDGMTLEGFRENYRHSIEDRLASGNLQREPKWSESLAVGSRPFVETVEESLKNRRAVDLIAPKEGQEDWVLKETRPAYA